MDLQHVIKSHKSTSTSISITPIARDHRCQRQGQGSAEARGDAQGHQRHQTRHPQHVEHRERHSLEHISCPAAVYGPPPKRTMRPDVVSTVRKKLSFSSLYRFV